MSEDERADGQEAGESQDRGEKGSGTADPAVSGAAPEPAAAEAPTTTEVGAPPAGGGAPPPKRRRRRRWVLALWIVGAVVVLLIIAAFVTAHFTSASSFCDSCHEMEPYYSSWQASTHASAECRDCHIPPGFVPYIETKLGSFREIWVHLTGSPEAPLAVTREIPNSSCERCHEIPPPDPSLPTVTFSHGGSHSDLYCISCHVRFVHRTVNPPYYQDPAAMSSCLECHNGSIAPDDCSYCHTAPHEPRGECSDCHNQGNWTDADFTTHPFPLTGAHANLACSDCHVSKPGVENIPGTSLGKADPACVSCHGDQHGGLTDCASCHTPTSWQNVNFTHPFELTGAHATLTCDQCHVSRPGGATVPGTQFPLPDPECVSCHGVQHGGLTDCASCHTTNSFLPSTFKHPRAGEHRATSFDCVRCHPDGYATYSCTCHGGNPPSDD